jgi:hypothetical protein
MMFTQQIISAAGQSSYSSYACRFLSVDQVVSMATDSFTGRNKPAVLVATATTT